MEKIRLLKFVCDFGSGGTEGQVFNLISELDPSRFAVELACLNKTGPFVEEYNKQGIAMHEFPIRSLCSPSACLQMWRLIRFLRQKRIEVLHAYNFYALVFAIPAAKLAGVPVVVASVRDRGIYLTPAQKQLQKLVCRLADRILVNAESIRDCLLEQGYPQHKITVINNGINPALYAPPGISDNHNNNIREDWGINDEAPLVVMLARLNRHKGVADFIQAAARVRHEHPRAQIRLGYTAWFGFSCYISTYHHLPIPW